MKKKEYIVPELTSVLIRAERGYASSGETVTDRLAGNVNNAVNEFTLQMNQEVTDMQLIGNTTETGYDGVSDNGLAAGYFTEQTTGSWF